MKTIIAFILNIGVLIATILVTNARILSDVILAEAPP